MVMVEYFPDPAQEQEESMDLSLVKLEISVIFRHPLICLVKEQKLWFKNLSDSSVL